MDKQTYWPKQLELLRAMQLEFIQRLIECPQDEIIRRFGEGSGPGTFSDIKTFQDENILSRIREFSINMAAAGKYSYENNLIGKIGEEAVKSLLGNLAKDVNYSITNFGDGGVDIELIVDEIALQVKTRNWLPRKRTREEKIWEVNTKEILRNNVLVCILCPNCLNLNPNKLFAIVGGFLPMDAIKSKGSFPVSLGIRDLAYGMGLRKYLIDLLDDEKNGCKVSYFDTFVPRDICGTRFHILNSINSCLYADFTAVDSKEESPKKVAIKLYDLSDDELDLLSESLVNLKKMLAITLASHLIKPEDICLEQELRLLIVVKPLPRDWIPIQEAYHQYCYSSQGYPSLATRLNRALEVTQAIIQLGMKGLRLRKISINEILWERDTDDFLVDLNPLNAFVDQAVNKELLFDEMLKLCLEIIFLVPIQETSIFSTILASRNALRDEILDLNILNRINKIIGKLVGLRLSSIRKYSLLSKVLRLLRNRMPEFGTVGISISKRALEDAQMLGINNTAMLLQHLNDLAKYMIEYDYRPETNTIVNHIRIFSKEFCFELQNRHQMTSTARTLEIAHIKKYTESSHLSYRQAALELPFLILNLVSDTRNFEKHLLENWELNVDEQCMDLCIKYAEKQLELEKDNAQTNCDLVFQISNIQAEEIDSYISDEFLLYVDVLDVIGKYDESALDQPVWINNSRFSLGRIIDFDLSSNKLILTVEYTELPDCISELTVRNKNGVLSRQDEALKAFRKQETLNLNLRRLVLMPWLNLLKGRKLQAQNKELIPADEINDLCERAMAARDFFLIQGPPGTGKSTIIVELLQRIVNLNRDTKILLTSQSNAAVNKLCEDLLCISKGSQIVAIRDESATNKGYTNILNFEKHIAEKLVAIRIGMESYLSNNERFSNADISLIKILRSFLEKISLLRHKEVKKYFQRDFNVFLSTCNRIPIFMQIMQVEYFDYVIIDEAAKASAAEIILSLTKGYRYILVGDHKQLPPFINQQVRRSLAKSNMFHSSRSFFMELFDSLPSDNKAILRTQFRMHESIAKFVGSIFYSEEGGLDQGVDSSKRTFNFKGIDGRDFGTDERVFWMNVDGGQQNKENGTSKYNEEEARTLVGFLLELEDNLLNKDESYDVGIISTYTAQEERLRQKVESLPSWKKLRIHILTVDSSQGEQMDIILYTVVATQEKQVHFAADKKRLNVAFSRAKRLLVVFGNFEALSMDKLFERIQEMIPSHNIIQPSESSKYAQRCPTEGTSILVRKHAIGLPFLVFETLLHVRCKALPLDPLGLCMLKIVKQGINSFERLVTIIGGDQDIINRIIEHLRSLGYLDPDSELRVSKQGDELLSISDFPEDIALIPLKVQYDYSSGEYQWHRSRISNTTLFEHTIQLPDDLVEIAKEGLGSALQNKLLSAKLPSFVLDKLNSVPSVRKTNSSNLYLNSFEIKSISYYFITASQHRYLDTSTDKCFWKVFRGNKLDISWMKCLTKISERGISVLPKPIDNDNTPRVDKALQAILRTCDKWSSKEVIKHAQIDFDQICQKIEKAENEILVISPWLTWHASSKKFLRAVLKRIETVPDIKIFIVYSFKGLSNIYNEGVPGPYANFIRELKKFNSNGLHIELREIGFLSLQAIIIDQKHLIVNRKLPVLSLKNKRPVDDLYEIETLRSECEQVVSLRNKVRDLFLILS